MPVKGLIGKIKERGITLRKGWKLGGKPVNIEHSIRKELDRALIVSTLRKVRVLLQMILDGQEKPTVTGMRKLQEEVDVRIKELGTYKNG